MKKILLVVLTSGVLLAQNSISGNRINTNGGNVQFVQGNNNQVSIEEIEINKKIDDKIIKILSSNESKGTKNMLSSLLSEAKSINQQQIPVSEKNRQCKFKAELTAKFLKFANVKLLLSNCDEVF